MKDYLVLVNAESPLPSNYSPEPLKLVDAWQGIFLEKQTAEALSALLAKVDPDHLIQITSGFRSIREQVELYQTSMEENGLAYTNAYVAKPYCSEHHTGLAVDLSIKSGAVGEIAPDFQDHPVVEAFLKEMANFGFIMRYLPDEKTEITGISHEPWHFRYVGLPHSQRITEGGLVLEEYLEKAVIQ
ncbi:D-alanyl-D-alanine carboxypeptidase family protein [Listeria costaricensis]|uniref:D-alanyl-D-alanine carboxypeptidase family protein n=1 Tax=Listeria costaricensis TaxID=2026604 RepID=UPI0013C48DF6|nr:D-alanyl-D-alanine carboxypeptidase family protein [Listeria costaricensis]